MLAGRDPFCVGLELLAGHSPVSAAFERQIGLEVRVQVLLQRHIPYEAHPAQCAVELYPREDLALSCFRRSIYKLD